MSEARLKRRALARIPAQPMLKQRTGNFPLAKVGVKSSNP
jgi:hypothetical protein